LAETNVSRFHRSVAAAGPDGTEQVTRHNEGVGTHWYDELVGGAFGTGLDHHILAGYRYLVDTYQDGDEVFVLGFSRGAYTARSLVGMVRNCGLLRPRASWWTPTPVMVGIAYGIYRTRSDGPDSAAAQDFRSKYAQEISIKFLGVWDTVGALGIPTHWAQTLNMDYYQFHDTRLSKIVENAYQAAALDEHREDYSVCLWDPSGPPGQTIEQRWFAGAHATAHSLEAFMKHFCARVPYHPLEAGHSDRPTMTQPNCYWRLEAPFVTIIGLYSNVSGELDNTDARATAQRDWLAEELRTAPADRCLLVAVHHPIYSLGSHGPTRRVAQALDDAVKAGGRVPDAVLSGHYHNYQRFTRKFDGRDVPYLVVGAGGMAGYDLSRVHKHRGPGEGVKLEHHNHQRPGFLRLGVTPDRLVGEYFVVPGPGRENDGEERDDHFTLDLEKHKLA
jgi:hypothetical protein